MSTLTLRVPDELDKALERQSAALDRDLLDLQAIDDISIIRPGEYWRRTTGIE